jgi:hypothetical protein
MADRQIAPYHIRLTVECLDPSRTIHGHPLFAKVIDITEDDLKLGIPAAIYGHVNKALADGIEQIALIERRKRAAPETVDLQESQ